MSASTANLQRSASAAPARLARSPARSVWIALGAIWPTMKLWHRRRATRRDLACVPFERLADLGLDPSGALREAGKPFWRA